jgi:hypothetical protein
VSEPKRHQHENEHKRSPERDREYSGDDPKAHAAILERRWLGSPPPSMARYALALRQWRQLPGAVVRPATDIPSAAGITGLPKGGPAGSDEEREP